MSSPIFNFYKDRGFSEYFADTFEFFKLFGKHYYKNYIMINGAFLIISSALSYYLSKALTGSTADSIDGTTDALTAVTTASPTIFAVLGILLSVIAVLSAIISISFPPLYMRLIEERDGTNFSTEDIARAIRGEILSMLGFFFLSCFVSLLIMIVFIIVAAILGVILTLISPWLLFVFVFIGTLFLSCFISFFSLAINDYLINKSDYFESLKNSLLIIKNNFSAIIWSTVVLVFIVLVVSTIITIVPILFVMTDPFTNFDINGFVASYNSSPVKIITSIVGFFFNIFLMSYILVNQGIIYYSSIVDPNKKMAKREIEEIGVN